MANRRFFMFFTAICTFMTMFGAGTSRAVNISNTWMLPEEDFPVFYRYFRDRISWYEADAVCQFHHANLVTADTSSQFDAIRAYLKELDIANDVWIGLSKKTDDSEFTWSDSRIMTGEGHWREALPIGGEPLCVTMDPTADFLWKPYSCGGPESASFICELPVPSWALGQKGCLLTELPSLTVLYIPEQMALELTSDCGMDGTKRITCRGNANREEILKQLTCAIPDDDEFEDKATSRAAIPSDVDVSSTADEILSTTSWLWTSNAVNEYEISTRQRRETEDASSSTLSTVPYVTEPRDESVTNFTIQDEGETSTSDVKAPEDVAEYPSAINQGQLFSIIENGTMFDIIELNDTGIDDAKPTKIVTQIKGEVEIVPTSTVPEIGSSTTDTPLQTTVQNKDKHPKKFDKESKVKYYKKSDPKYTDYSKTQREKDKVNDELNREMEIFPIVENPGPMVKLNRTYRKKLPVLEESEIYNEITNNNLENFEKFDAQEINKGNIIATTKFMGHDSNKIGRNGTTTTFSETHNETVNFPKILSTTLISVLDPNNDERNKNISKFASKSDDISANSQFLGEIETTDDVIEDIDDDQKFNHTVAQSLNFEPLAQKRPNRRRKLNNTTRRSYYPYFFSRVLG